MDLLFLLFMFIGSMLYVIGSYAHLSLAPWTFWKAYVIAMPLVAIEYQFSLRGNKWANESGISPINVLLITLCFYFISMYALNKLYLHGKVESKDFAAFLCILTAFAISFRDIKHIAG
jgi:hypothetical protein